MTRIYAYRIKSFPQKTNHFHGLVFYLANIKQLDKHTKLIYNLRYN